MFEEPLLAKLAAHEQTEWPAPGRRPTASFGARRSDFYNRTAATIKWRQNPVVLCHIRAARILLPPRAVTRAARATLCRASSQRRTLSRLFFSAYILIDCCACLCHPAHLSLSPSWVASVRLKGQCRKANESPISSVKQPCSIQTDSRIEAISSFSPQLPLATVDLSQDFFYDPRQFKLIPAITVFYG